jgi:hypothetical protein
MVQKFPNSRKGFQGRFGHGLQAVHIKEKPRSRDSMTNIRLDDFRGIAEFDIPLEEKKSFIMRVIDEKKTQNTAGATTYWKDAEFICSGRRSLD